MLGPFSSGGLFLIEVIFDLCIYIVLFRFILQWFGGSYYNPICQFLVKATDPIIKPVRRFIPVYKRFDFALVLLMVILQILKYFLISLLAPLGVGLGLGVVIMAIAELLHAFLNVFFFAIIIQALLSWVNPAPGNPISEVLYVITEPLLKPARRIIPPIGGFDISPIPVMIVVKLVDIVLVQLLLMLATRIG